MGELSDDAKAVLGAWFGMMTPDGILSFAMKQTRPTGRAKAALDECVAKGWLTYSPAVEGGHSYFPARSCKRWMKWLHANVTRPDVNFRLVEPAIDQKDPRP